MARRREVVVDLSDLRRVTNVVYWPLYGIDNRYLVLVGGAGSGKSVFATEKIAVRCMAEEDHNFIGFRKVKNTIETSIFHEFRTTLQRLGVIELWKANLTRFTWTYIPNGNTFRCFGLDDPEKIKSVANVTGTWVEEPTELTEADFKQIDLRLRGQLRNYKQHILTFNPISALHWLKKRFVDLYNKVTDCVVHTTYKDNAFIDAEYIRTLEEFRTAGDEYMTMVYVDGVWGVLGDLIYRQPDMQPRPDVPMVRVAGLDFGFRNPCALELFHVNDLDVYVEELIYERKLTNPMIIARLDELNFPRDVPIYGDSASPSDIEEIAAAGYLCVPCDKGAKSVVSGIRHCQKYNLHTTQSNVGFNKEIETYHWLEKFIDKEIPSPFNDHALDAMRYGLWTHFRPRIAPSEEVQIYDPLLEEELAGLLTEF